jgi:hypothetical protein
MTDQGQIIIAPVSENVAGENWEPSIGPEAMGFLSNVVPPDSKDYVSNTACSILAKGTPPTSCPGISTGLVVGYVQSGKTMSFETVTALARDNNFQMVIIIAGISKNLLEQSTRRIWRDLRLDDPFRERRWVPLKNPSQDEANIQMIRDVIAEWSDPITPEEFKKTILITVLKNHHRLRNLTSLLYDVGMENVPVLIIDDEADQASLNTEVSQSDESTTYRRLMELKDSLPCHTYLQYTATPQAPLLVNIIDSLSPQFVQVLEPGNNYIGGNEFFHVNQDLIRLIPAQDVPTNNNPLQEPPDSLIHALLIFMVGVSIGIRENRNIGNRSMLVHPSHLTAFHQEYYEWVRDIFEEWKTVLALPDEDPDKIELYEDFQFAYRDLRRTLSDRLPSFEDVVTNLQFAFRNTRILEVNARLRSTPDVDWRSAYGWILVGGQAMDRGFTIQGLTVTYMPRGIGVGNADTVQQRARFFGYKRQYIGYCRVFLEQGTLNAFQNYVDHEEDVRRQLSEYQNSGRPLNEWKRAFVLDAALRPCRRQVLEFDYIRGSFSHQWFAPRVVLATDDLICENRQIINNFCQTIHFEPDIGNPNRQPVQIHKVCHDISLRTALEQLLVLIRIPSTKDSQRYTGLLLQISKALEDDPNELCTIYRISPDVKRERGVHENGVIRNLFQGAYPSQPGNLQGSIYPGDRNIYDERNITIQIHNIDLTQNRNIILRNVPIIAVWVPNRLARPWISQEQPTQNSSC